MIGNDIVDLHTLYAQDKFRSPRYLAKTCSQQEQDYVLSSNDPHTALWTIWAIKEASYKIAIKQDINNLFIPSQFNCYPASNGWKCQYKNLIVNIETVVTGDFVHAVASTQDIRTPLSKVATLSVDNFESQEVRQLAIELLASQGYPQCIIERLTQNGIILPPQIFHKGKLLPDFDISLSHDGRYLAVAITC